MYKPIAVQWNIIKNMAKCPKIYLQINFYKLCWYVSFEIHKNVWQNAHIFCSVLGRTVDRLTGFWWTVWWLRAILQSVITHKNKRIVNNKYIIKYNVIIIIPIKSDKRKLQKLYRRSIHLCKFLRCTCFRRCYQ